MICEARLRSVLSHTFRAENAQMRNGLTGELVVEVALRQLGLALHLLPVLEPAWQMHETEVL